MNITKSNKNCTYTLFHRIPILPVTAH